MDQDKLRLEFLRLGNHKTIKDCIDVINIYSDYFLQCASIHQNDNIGIIGEQDARLIIQMLLTKTLHLKQLLAGINFQASNGVEIKNIIDPTVVGTLTRNLYETVAMFNLIYRSPKTEDEKLILYNLWVIAGYNYRQRFETKIRTPFTLAKLLKERKLIGELIEAIKITELFKSLNLKEQRKILNKVAEKDFKVSIENGIVKLYSWQGLTTLMGDNMVIMDTIYTYLSLYAHPSNVSVFQFGSFFENEDYLQTTSFHLRYFFILLSIFIADYITVFPNAKKTFENFDIKTRVIIEHFNNFSRGKDFRISDSLSALG